MLKKMFPIIGMAVFSSMLGLGILTPILPIYAKGLGATGLWVGIITASYSISRAFVMPVIGRWSDRKGRKIFLTVGLALYAIVSLMYILSTRLDSLPILNKVDNLTFLLVIRLIQGGVSGFIIPVARAWIGDLTPKGEEGRWQGYFNTAFFSGSAAGPFLGGVLADLNMNYAFAAMGVMNFISFLAVAFFLRENTDRKLAAKPAPVRELSKCALFDALFAQRTTLELGMAIYVTFLPLWAFETLNLSRTHIGAIVGGTMLVSSWLQLFTGRLADRFDRRKLVITGTIFNFAMVAAIPFAGNVGALIALIILRSAGGAISLPGNEALSINLGRRFGMGSTISVLGLATSIGMAAGPILGGFVNDYLGGYNSTFYFAGVAGLVGVGLFALLSYREKVEALEPRKRKVELAAVSPQPDIEDTDE